LTPHHTASTHSQKFGANGRCGIEILLQLLLLQHTLSVVKHDDKKSSLAMWVGEAVVAASASTPSFTSSSSSSSSSFYTQPHSYLQR
jgi:hypothetical protein